MQDAVPTQLSEQESIPTHPEEMKASFNLRVGKSISLQGSARITPAGVVTTGLMISAIVLAFGYLARSMPHRRP
ncbi:hypothetical protein DWF00_12030 [Bosea caraganae]|uniref:Uncharacterized protein n=1 Tax=Bosea caraganae TaxID=2763117 RepID=A0A370LCI1_9HYPH|nr:hypothetical protein [Bosea caraganae]RDJ27653.1 hypothetical protein DWF00_12030 [Bosea caraganae]RDJ29666.1 hypothetical protein DWE98_03800 [Bosea caraganae]